MNEVLNIKIKKDILEPLIKIHSKLTNELRIVIQKDGISIKSIDPAHCELLDTLIKDQACEEYYVKEDMELGIDTDKILDFLRLAQKNDLLRFSYDLDNNKLIVKWGNLTRTMGLIDTAGLPDPEIPTVDFGSKASVSTDLFHKALKSINADTYKHETQLLISEHGMGLEKYTEDDDDETEISSYIIDRSYIEMLKYNGKPVIFDKEFLQKMIYIFKRIDDTICIETNGYDSPLKISIDNNNSIINYWVAPCTPEDYKPEDHKEDTEEVEPEPEIKEEREITETEPELELEKPIEPVIVVSKDNGGQKEYDIYFDRESTCKPKGLPYQKYQWTYAMDDVKDTLEEYFSCEKQGIFVEIIKNKGFVFFAVDPETDKEITDHVGERIIKKLLPNNFVLIAWYRYKPSKWVAQIVEKI